MLSGGSHFIGTLTGDSWSCRKYSLVPMLSDSPKSATFITKLQSILHALSVHVCRVALILACYSHAVPCCQISVYNFHTGKILHSLSNLNAHIQQLLTHNLNLSTHHSQ